jgi:hypothetical protein
LIKSDLLEHISLSLRFPILHLLGLENKALAANWHVHIVTPDKFVARIMLGNSKTVRRHAVANLADCMQLFKFFAFRNKFKHAVEGLLLERPTEG